MGGQLLVATLVGIAGVVYCVFSTAYGGDKQALLEDLRDLSHWLGPWSLPVYVSFHALLISLCLPYALILEAGAAYLFGFFIGVVCVFSAKILSASLSFWIGRILFRSSTSARHWVESNKVFNVISKGVARDGWKFVLLARFSPVPSYLINYSLAATNVRFFVDFLLPTILGCIPMILQNTSIGSLTRAATSTHANGEKSGIVAYLFPAMGVVSSALIAWRIRGYTSKTFPSAVQAEKRKNTDHMHQ
ncbi:hypothetical protein KP509_1Z227400 [Ceratopteris richardii]|nr:hypothetical protein KP509_1Z227400 [Ceratopteris richardii]